MKISKKELETRMEDALRRCLDGIPFLEIHKIEKDAKQDGVRLDLTVELTSSGGNQRLIVEAKSNGQPRLARQAANQILRYRQTFPDAYGVFLAPYISPRAAEICREDGIGYVDLSGNCRLCFGQVYIEREGRPNRFAQKRDLRSLYSPRASRILRVLLANPKGVWKVIDLAREADVSLGLTSNVKKLLADREWIRDEVKGFVLAQPAALLSEWAENYSFRKNEILDCYSLKKPSEIEADLAEFCAGEGTRYALTGFSGAARMAPAVRYQRAFAYVDGDLKEIASQLKLKAVSGGANVSLLLPYDDGVFYGVREFEGIRTVSSVQTYLDLLGFRGRGEEAAKSVFEEVIKPQW